MSLVKTIQKLKELLTLFVSSMIFYTQQTLASPYDEAMCPDEGCRGDGGAGIVVFALVVWWWIGSIGNKRVRIWFTCVIGGLGLYIIDSTHKPFKIFVGCLMIAAAYSTWVLAMDNLPQKYNYKNTKDEEETHPLTVVSKYTSSPTNINKAYSNDEESISIHTQKVIDYIGSRNTKEIDRLTRRSSEEQRPRLVTKNDAIIFGEDMIDLVQRVAKESKFINDAYMLNELTSSYISQEDIEEFGGDFVYMARRVIGDVKRIAGISNSTSTLLIRPTLEDEEIWGADVLDLFYRVAQEQLKVVIDIEDYPLEPKYYAKKCPFCRGSIIRSTRLCESCQTGFSVDTLN